jgi:hypothetical protein
VDAGIAVELLCLRRACIVFMIAQAGIDGSLETMEFLRHSLFEQGTHAAIDDVARYQNEIRLLAIDHVYPSGKLLARVVIAQMEV